MNLQRQTRVKHLLKIITLEFRAYFNQDLQPQNMEIGQLTIQQLHILHWTFQICNCTNCDQLYVKICPAWIYCV